MLRTRDNVRPLFISPGHKIDLKASIDIVLNCISKYRIPEPLRRADYLSKSIKRDESFIRMSFPLAGIFRGIILDVSKSDAKLQLLSYPSEAYEKVRLLSLSVRHERECPLTQDALWFPSGLSLHPGHRFL